MNKIKHWTKTLVISTAMTFSGLVAAQDQTDPVVDLNDVIAQVQEVSTTTLDDGRVILTDQDGLSLYLFDVDQLGVSNCAGQCAVIWPVLTTQENSLPEPFSIYTRDDGSQQIVFEDSPLYYFISDQKEGDILGDGVNGVWHIIEISE
jgi:predicted lipoprotein with Yx(FWY)xxD motif